MTCVALCRGTVIGVGLALTACATVTYPDGTKVTMPALAGGCPTVTPYYTGYLNPWGYGTSGSYGGGYYPVYGGAWNNFNGWNRRGSAWQPYCRPCK